MTAKAGEGRRGGGWYIGKDLESLGVLLFFIGVFRRVETERWGRAGGACVRTLRALEMGRKRTWRRRRRGAEGSEQGRRNIAGVPSAGGGGVVVGGGIETRRGAAGWDRTCARGSSAIGEQHDTVVATHGGDESNDRTETMGEKQGEIKLGGREQRKTDIEEEEGRLES